MLNNPISFVRYDHCTKCHSNNSLECYDMFHKPINYSLLINRYLNKQNIDNVFNSNRDFCYFKCKKCGEYYRIDWRDTEFPIPLRSEFFVDLFISNTNSKI